MFYYSVWTALHSKQFILLTDKYFFRTITTTQPSRVYVRERHRVLERKKRVCTSETKEMLTKQYVTAFVCHSRSSEHQALKKNKFQITNPDMLHVFGMNLLPFTANVKSILWNWMETPVHLFVSWLCDICSRVTMPSFCMLRYWGQ